MHTKEPWKCETPCPGECCWHISGANGERINYPELSEKDARRIVACVNACAGIEDPQPWIDAARLYSHETVTAITKERDQLRHELDAMAVDLTVMMRGRDELLTAFKAARESLDQANSMPGGPITDTIWHGPAETLFDFMDAVIARAEVTK